MATVKLDVTLGEGTDEGHGEFDDVLQLVSDVLPEWSTKELNVKVRSTHYKLCYSSLMVCDVIIASLCMVTEA